MLEMQQQPGPRSRGRSGCGYDDDGFCDPCHLQNRVSFDLLPGPDANVGFVNGRKPFHLNVHHVGARREDREAQLSFGWRGACHCTADERGQRESHSWHLAPQRRSRP